MDTFVKTLGCLGKPCFSRLAPAIPVNTPGSSSLHHAAFLGAMGMRLGWVKLPGISIFSYSWLQPLEHLSSWKTMELTRLIISLVDPSISTKPHLQSQVSSLLSHLPSPVFSSGTHPACPLSVFFGRTLPPWQQLCQTDRHTPIMLEQMHQRFCIIKSFYFSHPLTLSMLTFLYVQ